MASPRTLIRHVWRRQGPARDLHVDVLVFAPRWRPSWIWELLDEVLPTVIASGECDPTSPAPALVALRALEFTRAGALVGHAFAVGRLAGTVLRFALPRPVFARRAGVYGLRWLGVSVYSAMRRPKGSQEG